MHLWKVQGGVWVIEVSLYWHTCLPDRKKMGVRLVMNAI